jgi:hypothetical protein
MLETALLSQFEKLDVSALYSNPELGQWRRGGKSRKEWEKRSRYVIVIEVVSYA